jgi:hypothetical protein
MQTTVNKIDQQHFWMQEFVDRAEYLLAGLLAREALPNDGICMQCADGKQAIWRCKDCTFSPLLCRSCMRHSHLNNPLHQIESWTGSFFRSAGLWEVGVYLLVQHNGDISCRSLAWQKETLEMLQLRKDAEEQQTLCSATNDAEGKPVRTAQDAGNETWNRDEEDDDNDDEGDENDDEDGVEDSAHMFNTIIGYLGDAEPHGSNADHAWVGQDLRQDIPRQDSLQNDYVRVVHMNGIHHIALLTCACHGAEERHADLLYNRLVPATFSRYKTLFTVAVLDDFRISNLETKASAYQYFQKLRRLTFPTAPARAPNLYQELLRLARVWRWLKKKKWAGHGNRKDDDLTMTAPGEFANFCPACPQPRINLPPDYKQDPNKWVYRRFFVADGNFKADHVRQKYVSDIWLSEGAGMFAKRSEYQDFLRNAQERLTVSSLPFE